MKKFNSYSIPVIWSMDDPMFEEAEKAVERMKRRSNWPSEQLIKDLVNAGEKEYDKI